MTLTQSARPERPATGSPAPRPCPTAPAEAYDTALLDLDGVVYAGADAVPHAVDSLRRAAGAGMRLAFATNNASRTPAAVAAHLTDLGVAASPDDVITSAQAAARLVAEQVPSGSAVLVVGGAGLIEAVSERGLRPAFSLDEGVAAVVQGYDPKVGWPQLAEASYAVAQGLPWVASNTDLTIPTARGKAPGNGTLVAAVQAAAGVEPQVAGKPLPPMHRECVLRSGARRPLVVGDRLDTDIEGACNGGVDSLLVLTGVTTARELLAAPPQQRPTYVANDLRGLLEPHPAVLPDGLGGFRCGQARAWLDQEGELQFEGPVALDALRALCAAAWANNDRNGPTAVGGAVLSRLGL